MSAENLFTRTSHRSCHNNQARITENIFIMESIFTRCGSSPIYPVVTPALHEGPNAGRFTDTLNVRIIAWSLILCKKYLTNHIVR